MILKHGGIMSNQTIAALNDQLRALIPLAPKTLGACTVTQGVLALSATTIAQVYTRVRTFSEFTEDNDPYGEHDFGSFEIDDQKFFWKIDYYDLNLEFASEDPSDPDKTIRVLTIMLAEEY